MGFTCRPFAAAEAAYELWMQDWGISTAVQWARTRSLTQGHCTPAGRHTHINIPPPGEPVAWQPRCVCAGAESRCCCMCDALLLHVCMTLLKVSERCRCCTCMRLKGATWLCITTSTSRGSLSCKHQQPAAAAAHQSA
jgi:hypothetical protein